MDFTELESHLKKYSQEHLLRFWNDLDATERNAFAAELGAIDFASLTELIGEYNSPNPKSPIWNEGSATPSACDIAGLLMNHPNKKSIKPDSNTPKTAPLTVCFIL